MSHRTSLIAASLALAVLALLAGGQQLGSTQRLGGPFSAITPFLPQGFPVHPRDMVQLYGQADIPVGGEVVLYSVPTDKWLVVVARSNAWFSNEAPVTLLERFGGVDTERSRTGSTGNVLNSGPGAADGLGWVFQPGSVVVISNHHQSNSADVAWSLIGYLAPL